METRRSSSNEMVEQLDDKGEEVEKCTLGDKLDPRPEPCCHGGRRSSLLPENVDLFSPLAVSPQLMDVKEHNGQQHDQFPVIAGPDSKTVIAQVDSFIPVILRTYSQPRL
jgi:hypothetical protein